MPTKKTTTKKTTTKKKTTRKRAKKTKPAAGNGSAVVEGLAKIIDLTSAEVPKKESATVRKLREFYEKNAHVIPGSVRKPTEKDVVQLSHVHGLVCDIKCVDTGEVRTINLQDAHQTKRTVQAQLRYQKKCRAERRMERRAARRAAQAAG